MESAPWIEAIPRDLRLAARTLARTPAFTATVVLTLALGIGANSAVFSAIDAVVLRPLPFPEGDQLMRLDQRNAKNPQTFLAPTRLTDWDRLNSTFQAVTGYYTEDNSETSAELPEKLKRAYVAPRFLETLGIAPALGRDFRDDEARFGGPGAVLISDRFWRRRFAADPNILGRSLRIGGFSSSIVGVMPASFRFPDRDVDLWSPVPMNAPYAQDRQETWFTAIGRLKTGATPAQALANLATVQTNLGRQYPKTDGELWVEIHPLKEVTVGGVRRSLWILFGSVSLLLLIACTNIAALLLARAARRQQEVSVRFSLGASRASMFTHLLAEAFVLALGGAAFGLLLAAGASRAFRALAGNLPRIEEIGLNWRIVLYSLACAAAATLLCGLLPAIRGSRRGLAASLASASRTQVSARRPLQFALVGLQVALAVTLLAGSALLLRSFQELGRVAPGFDPSRVLTLQISMSWGETSDMKGMRQRTDRILDTLRAVPGVEAAAISVGVPGVPFQYQTELKVMEGRAETEPKIIAENRLVSETYFTTMQIPLLAGETCRASGTPPTVVVNRSFANRYLMGTAAIGHHLASAGFGFGVSEIRGISGDARETGTDRQPVPTVYWCAGIAEPGSYFLVRTRNAPMTMAETLRRKIHEIEPQRSVFDMMPLEQHVYDALAENRLRTILLTSFALTAVSLACVGLYGMLSYLVSLRRREVGLRLALGAERGQILRQFLMQGLGVSAAGCAAGLALAFAFTRVLSGMLYGVSASDGRTLSSVVAVVLTVSALASFVPALRAAQVEPMQVLRDE